MFVISMIVLVIGAAIVISFFASFFSGGIADKSIDAMCGLESRMYNALSIDLGVTSVKLPMPQVFCFTRTEHVYASDLSECPYVKAKYEAFKERDEYDRVKNYYSEWGSGVYTTLDKTIQTYCGAEQIGELSRRCWNMRGAGYLNPGDKTCFEFTFHADENLFINSDSLLLMLEDIMVPLPNGNEINMRSYFETGSPTKGYLNLNPYEYYPIAPLMRHSGDYTNRMIENGNIWKVKYDEWQEGVVNKVTLKTHEDNANYDGISYPLECTCEGWINQPIIGFCSKPHAICEDQLVLTGNSAKAGTNEDNGDEMYVWYHYLKDLEI